MRDDKGKKGQVTLFIIIAIVIVVIGVLIFAFYPKLKATTGFSVENPEAFLQDCVGDDLRGLVKTISKQGGSLSPSNYAFYDQTELQYLCYTENYNEAGSRYPAFLVDSFQQEITENIKLTIDNCFDSLEENYKSKFYSTTLRKSLGKIETKILPKEIRLELLNYELTIAKDSTEKYTSFNILLNSNLYELLGISSDILEDEVNFGQADKTQYMMDNSNLEITGPGYSDGTNIYIIKNKKTNEVFQFASRSLVPQPGV